MKNRFLLIRKMKNFILQLDDILIHYPKVEYVLKDKIQKDSYEALEYMIEANASEDKLKNQIRVLTKLSMLDFYFEKSYKKKYISEKAFHRLIFELESITKMMYGWIKYDKDRIK